MTNNKSGLYATLLNHGTVKNNGGNVGLEQLFQTFNVSHNGDLLSISHIAIVYSTPKPFYQGHHMDCISHDDFSIREKFCDVNLKSKILLVLS